MPRPSKKAAEDKSKGVPAPVPAPAPVAAAPPPMPQPMMPAPAMQTPPGMMPQGHHQAHPQMQPYQQQPHNPLMQGGGVAPGQMRVIDNESFLRVRDSVSRHLLLLPSSSLFPVAQPAHCDITHILSGSHPGSQYWSSLTPEMGYRWLSKGLAKSELRCDSEILLLL